MPHPQAQNVQIDVYSCASSSLKPLTAAFTDGILKPKPASERPAPAAVVLSNVLLLTFKVAPPNITWIKECLAYLTSIKVENLIAV